MPFFLYFVYYLQNNSIVKKMFIFFTEYFDCIIKIAIKKLAIIINRAIIKLIATKNYYVIEIKRNNMVKCTTNFTSE